MLLFRKLADDPSDWLIKWIDWFTLPTSGTTSTAIDVILQRLDESLGATRTRLIPDQIRSLLGSAPDERPVLRRERILAAYLPAIQVGMIVRQGKIVSRLPFQTETFALLPAMLAEERPSLARRIDGQLHRILRPHQYALRGHWQTPALSALMASRCLVLKTEHREFVIPRTLLFQTFYGFGRRMVNAFCKGAWTHTARDLISFDHYQSGLETAQRPGSNVWRIVLRMGVPKEMAASLALLWFDARARACADAIYSESLAPLRLPPEPPQDLHPDVDLGVEDIESEQIEPASGASKRSWLSSARFPFAVAEEGLNMSVVGFALAPRTEQATITPFLVTAIAGLDWPYPDITIEWAPGNDNTQGDIQRPPDRDVPYMYNESDVVEGSPDAAAHSDVEPHIQTAINLFVRTGFSWTTEPPLKRQRKSSSQSYEAARPAPRPPREAACEVSGGNPGHEAGTPAKAELEHVGRDPNTRFADLVRALQRLLANGAIDGWTTLHPPDESLTVLRGGLACWSLLSLESRTKGRVPRQGWEVVYEPGGDASRKRYPRCVLIADVRVQSACIVILEIECRPTEQGTSLIAMHCDLPPDQTGLTVALDQIRHAKRCPDEKVLDALAVQCRAYRSKAIRHQYEKVTVGTTSVDRLDEDALLRSLLAVVMESSKLLAV